MAILTGCGGKSPLHLPASNYDRAIDRPLIIDR